MKKTGLGLLAVMMLFIPVLARAASLRPLLGINAEFGGDTLLTVVYTDGTKQDVTAGQGFSLFGGATAEGLIDLKPITIDLQATLGVKYSTISEASNASIDYFRFPLELLVFGHWKGLRVGAGPVYHFGNSISGSGVLGLVNATFDNAFGVTAQADYTFADHWNLGARYTAISYQDLKDGIASTNAGNFGIEFGYIF
jgi:hypothetical protein